MTKGGEFIISDELPVDIFTVMNLNDEQLMTQKTVKEFMNREVLTDSAFKRIETKDFVFIRQLMHQASELGLLGVEIPEEYGGLNLGKVTGAVVAEHIASQGSFAATFLAHTGIATYPLLLFGTKDQKQKYLPRLVSSELMGAYALTEEGAGSDAAAIKTKAVLTEDGKYYALNGKKLFVTNGGFADVFIVFAKINGDDSLHSAFIVEKSSSVEVGKEEHKMGIVGSSTVPVFLTDVMVPVENLLGQPGMGLKIAFSVLNLGRFKLAAACLGGARACLESALSYATRTRKQFGKYLIEFHVIREKLAVMAAYIYAIESTVYRTAGLLDEALRDVDTTDQKAVLRAIGEFAIECSAIKVFCSDVLNKIIADENVQIHGGSGYIIEDNALCAANYLLNSRINRIFEGTNEINTLLEVFTLLKRSRPKKEKDGSLKQPDIPLMDTTRKVVSESLSSMPSMSEPDNATEKLLGHLKGAKKSVLLAGGVYYQKFGHELETEPNKHQIILFALGECLTRIYVLDSTVGALAKNENEKSELSARLLFSLVLPEIERLVKKILACSASGDELRTQLAMVRKLFKHTPENEEYICNRLTDLLV